MGKTETAKRLAGTIREMDQPSVQEIASADLTKILSGKPPILIDEWQGPRHLGCCEKSN